MIRTQAGGHSGRPRHASAQPLRQEGVHLRDSIRFRLADVGKTARQAIGGNARVVEAAIGGQALHPE
jgi:hypothetical protein